MINLNSNIKIESIKRVVVYCLSHEKSRRSFSYYMNFLNELDQSLYERKDFNGLDNEGVLTLYNICNQILGESEIWNEYSIITGESLDELRDFNGLDSDRILTLYNISNQIIGESEILDEYYTITGETVDELRNFRNLLYKIITDT